jgi:hypothetical protein
VVWLPVLLQGAKETLEYRIAFKQNGEPISIYQSNVLQWGGGPMALMLWMEQHVDDNTCFGQDGALEEEPLLQQQAHQHRWC